MLIYDLHFHNIIFARFIDAFYIDDAIFITLCFRNIAWIFDCYIFDSLSIFSVENAVEKRDKNCFVLLIAEELLESYIDVGVSKFFRSIYYHLFPFAFCL